MHEVLWWRTEFKYWSSKSQFSGLIGIMFRSLGTLPICSFIPHFKAVQYDPVLVS